MKLLDKYFKRRFKTVTGVKIAIALKRPRDWVQLKLRGEKVLSHRYWFVNHGAIVKIKDADGNILNPDGYTIWTQIITQSAVDDIEEHWKRDVISELESVLVNELSEEVDKGFVDKIFKLGDKKEEDDRG